MREAGPVALRLTTYTIVEVLVGIFSDKKTRLSVSRNTAASRNSVSLGFRASEAGPVAHLLTTRPRDHSEFGLLQQ